VVTTDGYTIWKIQPVTITNRKRKLAMKKTAAILLYLTIALMSFSSHANNPNPKPKCPLGQIPVLDGNLW